MGAQKRFCSLFALAALVAVALFVGVGGLTALPDQAHAAQAVTCKVSGELNYSESYKFLGKLNKLRKQKGLRPLVMDKKLLKAAEQRAAETSVSCSHRRTNGTMCFTVSNLLAAENLVAAPDYNAAYEWWKNSPGHYKNMVRPSFRTAGVACFERDGERYWLNLFGVSKSGKAKKAGTKSKSFKVKIAKKYLMAKYMYLVQQSVESYSSTPATILYTRKGFYAPGILPNSLFTFKSSNPNVFTVDSKGVIHAKGEGAATLTAVAKKKKSCKFTQVVRVVDFLDGGMLAVADD